MLRSNAMDDLDPAHAMRKNRESMSEKSLRLMQMTGRVPSYPVSRPEPPLRAATLGADRGPMDPVRAAALDAEQAAFAAEQASQAAAAARAAVDAAQVAEDGTAPAAPAKSPLALAGEAERAGDMKTAGALKAQALWQSTRTDNEGTR